MTGSPVTINLNLLETRPLGATPHIVGSYLPRCHPHPPCSQKVVSAQPGYSKLQVPNICSSTVPPQVPSSTLEECWAEWSFALQLPAHTEYMKYMSDQASMHVTIEMVEMVEMDIVQTELQTSDLSRLISVFNQVQWERRKRQNGQSSYSNLSLENKRRCKPQRKLSAAVAMQRVQHQLILN